jgi:hypothetical protein
MRYIRRRGKAATPAPARWYFDHIVPCSSKIFPRDSNDVIDFPKKDFATFRPPEHDSAWSRALAAHCVRAFIFQPPGRLQKNFCGGVGMPGVQTSSGLEPTVIAAQCGIKERPDEQEHDLPLVQSRRRGSRAVLRKDVSEQQRRRCS